MSSLTTALVTGGGQGIKKALDYEIELNINNQRERKSKQKTLFDYPTT